MTAIDYRGQFRGRIVILTGACGVIGRWLAAAFAAEGARLVLSDRDAAGLAALAPTLGAETMTHATDLADAAGIAGLVRATADRWGAPDIVINNAGIYPSGWLLDIDAAEWDRIMDVNLRAPFLLSQHAAKAMIAAGKGGAIVNVSSGAARKMRTTAVPYCVSKTALDRLTKGFGLELARFGIRVNAVEPGFAAGSTASPLTEAHVAMTTAGIPLGRASAPDDAAGAVLWLCSDAAAYVTGATLSVDGGNSIGSLAVYQDKKAPL
jgi:3-oxoacyl-[acyl-carrier protein] reductase